MQQWVKRHWNLAILNLIKIEFDKSRQPIDLNSKYLKSNINIWQI